MLNLHVAFCKSVTFRFVGFKMTFIITDILKYSKIYCEAVRRTFPCFSGLPVTSDIEEYQRIYQNIQRYSLENDIYYHRYS